MLSLHTRSFLRRIQKNWEIYSLQIITLSIAFATAIVVVSFCITEFSVKRKFDGNVVRVLKRNSTTNRLTDRIPENEYKLLIANPNFNAIGRVKALNDSYAVDADFKKYFNESVDYNEDSIKSLGYNPHDFGVYATVKRKGVLIDGYELQPAKDIYFGPRVIGESERHGDVYCITILICITSLIIVLAATNFINLTSLTLPARSRELAMRKVAGAERPPLLGMLAKESLWIVGVSLAIGTATLVALDRFDVAHSIESLLVLALLLLVITISPLLPAWAFVKATPGRLLGTDTITFPQMKRVITVIQLGVSISLIIASLVIDRQISRSLIKEPGKNHDQVIYLPYPPDLTREGLNQLKLDWPRNNPNILAITAVSHTPDNLTSKPIGKDYYRLNVDFDFKDFFGLEIANGRWFGVNDREASIVNEAFTAVDSTSIGVVKNFAGIYNLPDKPVRITVAQDEYHFLMIRVLEVNIRSTLQVVKGISRRPVNIGFLDKNYEKILAYEDRLNNLSSLLALVFLVMACCAIYALSLSRMKDNLKQIAIRKTFGASNRQIVRRLSWQFLELMLVALFFFGPVTYWLLKEWLRSFAYSAKFEWADPLVAIGVCLAIVGITNLLLLGRVNGNTLKELQEH